MEDDAVTASTEVELQTDWSAAIRMPEQVASQFLVQLGLPADGGRPDGVHLIVGHASPPLVVSDDSEVRRQQIEEYDGKLPVTVHGRYFLTRSRLEQLRGILDKLATEYDRVDAATKGGGHDD